MKVQVIRHNGCPYESEGYYEGAWWNRWNKDSPKNLTPVGRDHYGCGDEDNAHHYNYTDQYLFD
ncbi:hypothetical protein JCM16816_13030 [Thermoanaerobacter brockii subsp. lactiethylicus]